MTDINLNSNSATSTEYQEFSLPLDSIQQGNFVFPNGSVYVGEYVWVPIPSFNFFEVMAAPAGKGKAVGGGGGAPKGGKKGNEPAVVEEPVVPLPPNKIMRHGRGKYICKETWTVYEGDWAYDVCDGKGKIEFLRQNAFYEGEFMSGTFHGQGSFHWQDGSSYTGEWLTGLPSGKGVYSVHHQDLVTWHGEFLDGKSNILHYKVK